MESVFARQQQTALDDGLSVAERRRAAEALAFGDAAGLVGVMSQVLVPQTPVGLQESVLTAVAAHPADEPVIGAISAWGTLTPALRLKLVDGLLRSRTRVVALLETLAVGEIRPQEIAAEHRQQLLGHPTAELRERAAGLFGPLVAVDRERVIAEYTAALPAEGDPAAGRGVFEKRCAGCHRLGSLGHAVGPDFASIQNKSDRDLLIAILDPNREAQPNFTSYTALMTDGRVFSGLIVHETADTLTLRRAEGQEDIVLRRDIELLQSTGLSLMPTGIEQDLAPADLADVLAFVRASLGENSSTTRGR